MKVLHERESLFPLMDGRRNVNSPRPTTATSRKARIKVAPKEDSQAGIILRYIRQCGPAGACDFEGIRDLVHLIPTIDNCYRARRGKLFENDLIKLAGFTRKSQSGGDCDVWIAITGEPTDGQEKKEPDASSAKAGVL